MKRMLMRSFVVFTILLLLWITVAPSCMTFRKPDNEMKKEFEQSGIQLTTVSREIDGRIMHYAKTGSDTLPTLFFVHGTPGSWDAFAGYLQDSELLSHYRLISVDRPGFGYSDFGNAMNLTEQTTIISEWMDSVYNNKPFIIIGHSLGGPMTIKLAAARPQYTKALVILAGSQDPADQWK